MYRLSFIFNVLISLYLLFGLEKFPYIWTGLYLISYVIIGKKILKK